MSSVKTPQQRLAFILLEIRRRGWPRMFRETDR